MVILLAFPFLSIYVPFISFSFLSFSFPFPFVSLSFPFLSIYFPFISFSFLSFSFHFPFISFCFPFISFYFHFISFCFPFISFLSFNLLSFPFISNSNQDFLGFFWISHYLGPALDQGGGVYCLEVDITCTGSLQFYVPPGGRVLLSARYGGLCFRFDSHRFQLYVFAQMHYGLSGRRCGGCHLPGDGC